MIIKNKVGCRSVQVDHRNPDVSLPFKIFRKVIAVLDNPLLVAHHFLHPGNCPSPVICCKRHIHRIERKICGGINKLIYDRRVIFLMPFLGVHPCWEKGKKQKRGNEAGFHICIRGMARKDTA